MGGTFSPSAARWRRGLKTDANSVRYHSPQRARSSRVIHLPAHRPGNRSCRMPADDLWRRRHIMTPSSMRRRCSVVGGGGETVESLRRARNVYTMYISQPARSLARVITSCCYARQSVGRCVRRYCSLGRDDSFILRAEACGPPAELMYPDKHTCIHNCTQKGKGSPYSFTERRVPELIPVLCSQPAGDVSQKPGGKLPLLSARPAVIPATLKRAATNFAAW